MRIKYIQVEEKMLPFGNGLTRVVPVEGRAPILEHIGANASVPRKGDHVTWDDGDYDGTVHSVSWGLDTGDVVVWVI